ncbi:MFS transporter [Chloroflexota bacterium]
MPDSRLKDKLYYGWVVVVILFISGITIWGVRNSFGVFFKSIESDFGLTRALTSAVFSTQMLFGGIFSVLSGWAFDRYGPRIILLLMGLSAGFGLLLTSQASSSWQLFLTYSLLLAMGTGPIWIVPMSTVSRWFDKRRGLAMGIATLGVGLGPMIMAPFATYLITNFDWRVAFIALGVIIWLVVIPLSRFLKRDPSEIGTLSHGVKSYSGDASAKADTLQPGGLSLSQAFRTRSFWLIIFSFFLFASNFALVLTHLVPHVTDTGFSAAQGATVLSISGGAAVVGRILMGIVSDRFGRRLTVMVCMLLNASAMTLLLWTSDLWMFYLFAIVYGYAWGGSGPCMAALVGDTFGVGKIGSILGLMDAGFSVGAAIGPVMGGLIFDVSHSYFVAFSYGVAAMLMVTLLISLVRREAERVAPIG